MSLTQDFVCVYEILYVCRALWQHAAGCIDKKIAHTDSLKAFRTANLILLKLLFITARTCEFRNIQI